MKAWRPTQTSFGENYWKRTHVLDEGLKAEHVHISHLILCRENRKPTSRVELMGTCTKDRSPRPRLTVLPPPSLLEADRAEPFPHFGRKTDA